MEGSGQERKPPARQGRYFTQQPASQQSPPSQQPAGQAPPSQQLPSQQAQQAADEFEGAAVTAEAKGSAARAKVRASSVFMGVFVWWFVCFC